MEYKKYSEENDYSYSFGGFPTYEILKNNPQKVIKVFVSSKLQKNDEWQKLETLCTLNNIAIEQNDKQIERITQKGNIYIVGVFKKYQGKLDDGNTIVLHNPSDMGNLGTIMRIMVGFGYKNLAIIKPCADYFNPKTIRASMGAVFSLNIQTFDSFEDFEKQNKLPLYLFMLNGTTSLNELNCVKDSHALVFGNEATGLPKDYTSKGTSVKIKHSGNIDSLNLAISVGIATYQFSKDKFW